MSDLWARFLTGLARLFLIVTATLIVAACAKRNDAPFWGGVAEHYKQRTP